MGSAGRKFAPAAFFFALTLALPAPGARAQVPECDQLRAALAQPASVDPSAAAGARQARAELERVTAHAHGMGCDNQQFLFFGSPPPPQCGGLKSRISALKARYDSLAASASGDTPQRRALRARYNQLCAPPRQKNFFETLFGGGDSQPSDQPPPDAQALPGGSGAYGGSQAVCVRTCDGGFFPLNFSARSAPKEQLANLCQALCPNAEVKLYTRVPSSTIDTALGADGTPYRDLPNALKFQTSFDPGCTCKPPNQSWADALAPAEKLLGEMGGARASDTIVTEEQSQAMAQQALQRPPTKAGGKPNLAAPPSAAAEPAPKPTAANDHVIETKGPDGAPRQVRIVPTN
ncbi:DUF2865 domain-containing protein [Rhodoblastus sp.]|uniref:DUF2865 domain-containing protein n=1 Tax=Rhodoblastus sp. TaxID=1962975 RepID=UPI0026193D87|nr:DUF2865 domain-containing protein [Rhodoblastus sp.]